MTARTVVHDTFVIDRIYAAGVSRVFNAFADPDTKKKWWGDDDFEKVRDHVIDFRVGGRESLAGRLPDGSATVTYDALYQDIVPDSRFVYSYEMTINDRRISVSVATVEFYPEGTGTRLLVTEQGAYLDGLDTRAQREAGTQDLLDALGTYLEGTPT